MAVKKIVVCNSQGNAQAQEQVLKRDGYQTTAPRQWDRIIWNATEAGGGDDIRQNVWVVEGKK